MGKQARLKQARREGKEVKKEPVYNMTQAQLDDYATRQILKFKKDIATEITEKLVGTMLIQCFDVLHNTFGFGNLRLQRFRYKMDEVSEFIADVIKEEPNYDYSSDVIQALEDKKIDVDKLLSGDISEHSLRRMCDMEKLMPKVVEVNNSGKEETEANK